MTEIINLEHSPKPNKRFRIWLDITGTGDKIKHWDFGSKGSETFIDHGDGKKRANYLKRHLANKTERQRIEGLIPSPALFSARLLWGDSQNLLDNVVSLNSLFRSKK